MAKATGKNEKSAIVKGNYTLSVKISEKGAVSVYGLQRFPVSLYADQWLALLDRAPHLIKFISDNTKELLEKAGKKEGATKEGHTGL